MTGQVRLAVPAAFADLGPVVVYLDPADGRAAKPPAQPAEIRQAGARFQPDFLLITAGQHVTMPNDDTIYHNVFSYSKPNDFDLGYYPGGAARGVTFEHPGVVQIYCSIHESMSGTIFVAPSRHHARVRPDGRFRIEGVPTGAYTLGVWSRMLPPVERDIAVTAGEPLAVDLTLGAAGP